MTLLDDWSLPHIESTDEAIRSSWSLEAKISALNVEMTVVIEEITHLMRSLDHNITHPAHTRTIITAAGLLHELPHPVQLQHTTVRLWPAGKRYLATVLGDTDNNHSLRIQWPNQPTD